MRSSPIKGQMKTGYMSEDIRTPIVCVLGHVDHGKTSLLDKIRGSRVIDKESGAITQHIGATEVPISAIKELCGTNVEYGLPGLLFIDTPGHHAFTTLRNRGGALADLAVLIVDIVEGFQPQTIESINILKRYKTPFIVAANKIDRIGGWRPFEDESFVSSYKKQGENIRHIFDDHLYSLIEQIYKYGFSSDRYDRVRDFQKNISVVPMSAKTGEGVSDLLLILIGLAQRFLEESLKIHAKGPGKGVILEIKEEKGLGITLDTILYDGMIKEGDTIVVGGKDKPVVTKVKALLKPSPMTEIRVEKRFNRAKKVTAAAGIKISAPKLEDALAGSPLVVANDRVEEIKREMEEEISEVKILGEVKTDGIVIKADTIGSLDALIGELKEKEIPIRMADIGDISKRDIIEAETVKEELYSVLIGFNVNVLPNARQYLMKSEVKVFVDDVIYNLIDEYLEWFEEKRSLREKRKIEAITRPGRIEILPDFVFRSSKPAIVGVRVLAGSIKPGLSLINDDGRYSGSIKQIQDKGETIKVADKDMEVAMSIEDVTVGRQIKEGDTLNIDIPEKHAKILEEEFYDSLSCEDADVFKILIEIKRKDNPFWAK